MHITDNRHLLHRQTKGLRMDSRGASVGLYTMSQSIKSTIKEGLKSIEYTNNEKEGALGVTLKADKHQMSLMVKLLKADLKGEVERMIEVGNKTYLFELDK